MALKTTLNYSPNFNAKKRVFKKIKFIIFHYPMLYNIYNIIVNLELALNMTQKWL